MHLLGLAGGGPRDGACLVLIRRERRGVAKRYCIIEAEDHPPGAPGALLADRIAAICRRPELITTTVRFSQIGRPRKRIRKAPTVLLDVTRGDAVAALLRERKIAFHTVLRGSEPSPWRVCQRAGYPGGEFHVPDSVLADTFFEVRNQDRVIVQIDSDAAFGNPPLSAGDRSTAAAICIWYEENLQRIRRLQPGAPVVSA